MVPFLLGDKLPDPDFATFSPLVFPPKQILNTADEGANEAIGYCDMMLFIYVILFIYDI